MCVCVKFLLFCCLIPLCCYISSLVISVKYLFFCLIFWSELWGIVVMFLFENQRRSIIFFTMIELLQTVPDQRSGSFRNLLLHCSHLLPLHYSHYGSPFGTDSPTTAAAAAVMSRPLPVLPASVSPSSNWAPGSAPTRTRPG